MIWAVLSGLYFQEQTLEQDELNKFFNGGVTSDRKLKQTIIKIRRVKKKYFPEKYNLARTVKAHRVYCPVINIFK